MQPLRPASLIRFNFYIFDPGVLSKGYMYQFQKFKRTDTENAVKLEKQSKVCDASGRIRRRLRKASTRSKIYHNHAIGKFRDERSSQHRLKNV